MRCEQVGFRSSRSSSSNPCSSASSWNSSPESLREVPQVSCSSVSCESRVESRVCVCVCICVPFQTTINHATSGCSFVSMPVSRYHAAIAMPLQVFVQRYTAYADSRSRKTKKNGSQTTTAREADDPADASKPQEKVSATVGFALRSHLVLPVISRQQQPRPANRCCAPPAQPPLLSPLLP